MPRGFPKSALPPTEVLKEARWLEMKFTRAELATLTPEEMVCYVIRQLAAASAADFEDDFEYLLLRVAGAAFLFREEFVRRRKSGDEWERRGTFRKMRRKSDPPWQRPEAGTATSPARAAGPESAAEGPQ